MVKLQICFKKAVLFTAIVLFTMDLKGQELVFNGSFEIFSHCPVGISMMRNAIGWSSPTKATPDYFHTCAGNKTRTGVPVNIAGKQKPFEAKGYAGMVLYENTYFDYKEYITTELTQPLRKDWIYEISFNLNLAETSAFTVEEIHALLSEEYPAQLDPYTLNKDPQLHFEIKNVGSKNWVLFKQVFKASGNERFLTIGNFHTDRKTKLKQINKPDVESQSYYFIDHVGLAIVNEEHRVPEDEIYPAIHDTSEYPINTLFVLENIYFDTDKATLKPESFRELDKLINFLFKEKVNVEIRGHTDIEGTKEHNQVLSINRAKAVKEYLVSKGVDPVRIVPKGFGQTLPISSNDTPDGRAHNRRVEFLLQR